MRPKHIFDNSGMVFAFLLGSLILWILLILAAPIMRSSEVTLLNNISVYIYFIFEPVCHQIPDRSIFINSEPMAVCSRCFSTYVGGFFSISFLALRNKSICFNLNRAIWLCIPAMIDFVCEKFGLYPDIQIIRITTGFLLGIGISYLIVFSITDSKNNYIIKWKLNNGKPEIN